MIGQARFGEAQFAGSPIEVIYRGSLASLALEAQASPAVSTTSYCTVSFDTRARASLRAKALLGFHFSVVSHPGVQAVSIIGFAAHAHRFAALAQVGFTGTAKSTILSEAVSQVSFIALACPKIECWSRFQIHARAKPYVAVKASTTLSFEPSAGAAIRAAAVARILFSSTSEFALGTKAHAALNIRSRLKTLFLAASGATKITYALHARPFVTSFPVFETQIRLKVRDVDLTHRVVSWTLRFEHDAGSWVLEVVFTNHAKLVEAGEGLAPWDPISKYNRPWPLLGSYNPVTLEIYRPSKPVWTRLFTGWAGPATVSAPEVWGEGDQLRATFVGLSQPLKDWIIEDRLALRYTKAAISKQGRPDLLNRIVMDQGFDYEIVYKDDPMFMVDEYIISGVSLWEALVNALAPTGFRLVEWWDPATGETRLTVLDPLRFKSTPDLQVVGGFSARNISGNESEVRTWVGVVYRDRYDFQEKFVWAESSPEILALYGIPDGRGGRKHRKMVYKTSDRSLVDTESEARELAAVILWDLETPCPAVEISFPQMRLDLLPFQLVEFIGENFSTLVGITEVEHSWSWDRPFGQTLVRGARGRVVGARHLWFARDVRREGSWERIMIEDVTEKSLSIRPGRAYVAGSFFQHQDGTPKPVVDVIFPPPPPWADGIVLKIMRLSLKDSAEISSIQGRTVFLANRNYPPGRFSGACSDYLVFFNEATRSGPAYRISTVSGNAVYLAEDPEATSASYAMIVRVRRMETRTYPIVRFVRIEDVTEGELIMVWFAWKGRS